MSDNFTRRNLLGVTGAGLALSACNGWGPSGTRGEPDRDGSNRGSSSDYGDSPTASPSASWTFEPKSIALVHVELLQDWAMQVNYTSLDLTSKGTDETRLKRAAAVFAAKSKPTNGKKPRFRDLKYSSNNYQDMHYFSKHNGVYDYDDFTNFKFENQTEIFFFFDHPHIEFGSPLIIATEFNSASRPCAENYSFYGAVLVPENDSAVKGLSGRILRVRNYVRNKDGSTTTKPVDYSLNIRLSIKNAGPGGGTLPIFFDPDTGNGVGYEP